MHSATLYCDVQTITNRYLQRRNENPTEMTFEDHIFLHYYEFIYHDTWRGFVRSRAF